MGLGWRLLVTGMFLIISQTVNASSVGGLRIVSPDGRETLLSEDKLLSLPRSTITTRTAWTEGSHLFEGMSLGKILETAGIDYQQHPKALVTAIALNDYEVEFPVADVIRYDVLIAAFMDGERLSVRDKGPYWVIYPRDDFRELRDSRFDHRWAWQLKELQIR